MKIDLSSGDYCFKLDEGELKYDFGAGNIIQAKELYLKHISELVDEAIDDMCWKLSRIEKEIND